jgi:hypothetical protein
MDRYEALYSYGEEYFLKLLKQPEQCRSTINGLSNTMLFNDSDHYTSANGIIHFYLADKSNTFVVFVNLLKNTYTVTYYSTDDEDFDHDIFRFGGLPYHISEEWFFQLSTVKHLPFSYEFHLKLMEYVDYLENIMQVNHCVDVLRKNKNIVPYPYR